MVAPSKLLCSETLNPTTKKLITACMWAQCSYFLPFEFYWRNVLSTVLQLSVLCTYKKLSNSSTVVRYLPTCYLLCTLVGKQ